jgi:uncharacterized protein (UPF0264 family)
MRAKLSSRAERGRVGLLVSVRSAAEAVEALAGGADVIDVKEPSRGSLGAADRRVVEDVVRVVANRAPVTVAGGELRDYIARPSWSGPSETHDSSRPRWSGYVAAGGVAVVKYGFAGCAQLVDWRRDWSQVCGELPGTARPVAVVYADWQSARAVAPADVLRAAVSAGSPAVLVDTWDKATGCLFEHWSTDELVRFIADVQGRGLLAVIAGSLSASNLRDAIALYPDYVAVRGAACDGGRSGEVSRDRVEEIRSVLMENSVNTSIVAAVR